METSELMMMHGTMEQQYFLSENVLFCLFRTAIHKYIFSSRIFKDLLNKCMRYQIFSVTFLIFQIYERNC